MSTNTKPKRGARPGCPRSRHPSGQGEQLPWQRRERRLALRVRTSSSARKVSGVHPNLVSCRAAWRASSTALPDVPGFNHEEIRKTSRTRIAGSSCRGHGLPRSGARHGTGVVAAECSM